MTANEIKLLDLIENNDNPEQALLIAVGIITDHLKRCELSELKSSDELREFA